MSKRPLFFVFLLLVTFSVLIIPVFSQDIISISSGTQTNIIINDNNVKDNTITAQILKYDGDSFAGTLSEADDVEIYRVDVKKAGRENIEVNAYFSGLFINLISDDGKTDVIEPTRILNGTSDKPVNRVISVDLEPGTYYLKFTKRISEPGKYSIKVSHTPANSTDNEPNDSIQKARILKYNGDTVTGFLSWSDDVDYYKLTIPKLTYINYQLTSYLNAVDLDILMSDGSTTAMSPIFIPGGSNNMGKTFKEGFYANPGTYYIRVKKNNGSTGKYTLKLNAPKVPYAIKVDKIKSKDIYITGTAPSRSIMNVYVGRVLLGQGSSDSNGKFKIRILSQKPGTVLYVYSTDLKWNRNGAARVVVSK